MDSKKLSSLIPKIVRGDYSQGELVEFINFVQKISLSYLKYQEVIGKHIRWERRRKSGELEDLAIDCVAGLFMRNDNNEFIQLRRYFGPYLDSTMAPNDVELLIMLRRLVIKKTKQELSRIFKERDPEGAKIIRNIRVAVKNAADLATFREMGREYIYVRNGKSSRLAESERVLEGAMRSQERPAYANATVAAPTGHSAVSAFTVEERNYLRKVKPTIPEKA